MPSSRNARVFYRAAKERFEDAELILSLNRTTAAVYLAGYSVECMIKALILSAVPRAKESTILAMFRGGQAHDYDWLIRLYRQHGGVAVPQHLALDFARVRDWSTGMRYSPKTVSQRRAKDFLASAAEIIKWADGRLSTGGSALIMARIDRSKKPDSQVQQVLDVLVEHERVHPNALIESRRTDYDFIHVRIIDPDFQGVYEGDREKEIWSLLYSLPSEIISDITSVVLVTPEEAPHNGSSIEFDDPLPPLPVPDLSAPLKTSFWEIETTNGSQNGMLSVPLEAEEFEAVRQIADSEGIEHSELIRGWVREKLQLSPS